MILILFYLIATAMMALLVFVLLKSVMNPSARDETNHREVNIGIARDRKSLIKDALSKGNIDQATYDQELKDIESTLANELTEGANSSQSRFMRGFGSVFIVGLAIGVSVLLYERLGSSSVMSKTFLASSGSVIMANGATVDLRVAEALRNGTAAGRVANQISSQRAQPTAQPGAAPEGSLETLLPQLEARLQENPDDLQGWTLLSRTYMNISDYEKAELALTEVNRLDDSNPEMIIMLAEAKALQDNGNLLGEPQTMIKRALGIDPKHERGRLLMALSLQQSNEHEEAIAIFKDLRSSSNIGIQGAANIDQMMNQSLAALGEAPDPSLNATANAANANANAANANAEASNAGASNASISVSAEISAEAIADVKADDSVFIFARATEGPPMPLAVVRLTVADLPITVTLDDTQAMIPGMTLSTFPSVTVAVRVSPSGSPIAQTGDWYGEVTEIPTAEPGQLSVVVDQQTP